MKHLANLLHKAHSRQVSPRQCACRGKCCCAFSICQHTSHDSCTAATQHTQGNQMTHVVL
jgi:hypothetical protein